MKYVKKYEEMSHNLKSLESKIIGLEGEARNIDAEYEPLDNEYLKLRVLEDPRADAKKAELIKMRERRGRIREEIEEAKKSKQIMIIIINEYRDKARHEINDHVGSSLHQAMDAFGVRSINRFAPHLAGGLHEELVAGYLHIDSCLHRLDSLIVHHVYTPFRDFTCLR